MSASHVTFRVITLVAFLILLNREPLTLAQEPSLNESLYTACLNRDVPKVAELLKQGADPNAANRDGYTPLHIGALQGGFGIVELLLKNGAEPNVKNKRDETPLHKAVSDEGDLKVVKLLVEAGAKLDQMNDEGCTPVRLAAQRGSQPIYEFLVATNGGKEPRPARHSPEKLSESTKDLIAALASDRHKQRLEAQREMVLRGQEIIPDVLASIEGGARIEPFYELFAAMGPEADAALPKLEALLADKRQVFASVITIRRMHPDYFDKLKKTSRETAAATLYEAAVDSEAKEMAGYLTDQLSRMGDVAGPHFLKLLGSDDNRIQRIAVSSLRSANFSSDEVKAELIKLSRDENNPLVRYAAADALGKFGKPNQEAKAALLSIMLNPPRIDPRTNDEKERQRLQQWRIAADRAARSLAAYGPEIIDELIPQLSPIEKPQRFPALIAIQSIGAPAVPRLIELLAHEDSAVATSASVSLSRIGTPAAPALAKVVSTGNDQVVSQAANALMWIGSGAKDTLPTLLEVAGTEKKSDITRIAACWAATKVDPQNGSKSKEILACIPTLIRVLEKGTFRHQGWAAETLKGIGPPAREALPMLRQRLVLPGPDIDTNGLVPNYVRDHARAAISAIEVESDKPLPP